MRDGWFLRLLMLGIVWHKMYNLSWKKKEMLNLSVNEEAFEEILSTARNIAATTNTSAYDAYCKIISILTRFKES